MIVLEVGDATVQIDEQAGGRIAQITVQGEPLLRGPEHESEGWQRWGCYPLLPWSNRIPGGVFEFERRRLEVPVNNDDGSALHGLAADRLWNVTASTADRAELDVFASAGSYQVRGRQSLHLHDDFLEHMVSVTNLGTDRVPAGLGVHPWFRSGPISVPADAIWPGDGPLPTGPPIPVDDTNDLRSSRVPPAMDRCLTQLTASAVEVPGVRLSWEGPVTQVVVYSETPGWVCVEPVTMANDGFRLAASGIEGTGVIALDPEAMLSVTYRYEWRARPS